MSASQKLDLKTVFSVTYDARNKWSNILLQLDVNHSTIESINTKYRDSPDDCYRAGLSEWLKGGERNWSDMIDALASPTVGHFDLAKLLEKEYLKDPDSGISDVEPQTVKIRGNAAAHEQRVNKDLVIFIGENVGNGVFGAVFKGSFKGRLCAVKLLHHFVTQLKARLPGIPGNKDAIKALERECAFLKSLNHENIVQHISTEHHSLGGNMILVTELMDCNLRSYLSGPSKESLNTDGEMSLCQDVASGLAYIHSEKMIHRDLCNDNILLKYKCDPKVPVAKISDFGMSRMIDPSTLSSTLSSIPNRKGYLPPEATEDKYDQSLDVFSLGVIMMQIVLRLESVQSAKERSEHIAQLSTTHKLTPLIMMCLEVDPKKRPSASNASTALSVGGGLELLGEPRTDDIPNVLRASDCTPAPKPVLESCAEYNSYPLSEQECWAITTIKAPDCDHQPRVPVDIVIVIDKSGSMRGDKLRLVKHALTFMIDKLKETDRLSVISYDRDVYVNFGLLEMNAANRSRAKSEIASLYAGSSTNLCGGLMKGMQMLSVEGKAQVQTIMLLTDGLANSGPFKERGEILDAVRGHKCPLSGDDSTYRSAASKFLQVSKPSHPFETPPRPPLPTPQNPPPVLPKRKLRWQPDDSQSVPVHSKTEFEGTIYTFGFGSDHDATLLEAISTQGGGVYYYIDSCEKIPASFATCLGGVLSVIAQNLSLKLELLGGNIVSRVHANRTVTWRSPEKIVCDIGMGDLQSEEERDVVLELKLPAVPSPQQDLVLKASLSYFNVITSAMESTTFDLIVDRKDGNQGPMNESVDVQRNRITALKAVKRAMELSDQDRPYEAQRELDTAMAMMEITPTYHHVETQSLMKHLQQGAQEMKSPCHNHRGNYLRGMHQSHAVQRVSDSDHGPACSPCHAKRLTAQVQSRDTKQSYCD